MCAASARQLHTEADIALVVGAGRSGEQDDGCVPIGDIHCRWSAALHARRPGPLVEVNRRSDVDLLRDLDRIIDFDT
jgi:hypothetical protein